MKVSQMSQVNTVGVGVIKGTFQLPSRSGIPNQGKLGNELMIMREQKGKFKIYVLIGVG